MTRKGLHEQLLMTAAFPVDSRLSFGTLHTFQSQSLLRLAEPVTLVPSSSLQTLVPSAGDSAADSRIPCKVRQYPSTPGHR